MTQEPLSYGRRLAELAALHPDKTAVVFVSGDGEEQRISWDTLHRRSSQMARLLADRGANERSMVIIGLPNCPEHLMAALAAWKLGACVLPLSGSLPGRERDELIALAQTYRQTLVVADWDVPQGRLSLDDLKASTMLPDGPLPDRVSQPGKAMGSGGSTGRPKIIVSPNPWAMRPGAFQQNPAQQLGFKAGQVQLVAGRLYHNSPFSWAHKGLFEDHLLVLMDRFDAARALDLVERYRVEFAFLVPTMMWRMLQVPGIKERDFSKVQSFWHTAAPCPPWVKRAWIDLLGPERLFEAFGSAESVGSTLIRGDEWLTHPGSVGRPGGTVVRIVGDDGQELPAGEVGEIFMQLIQVDPEFGGFFYLGSPPPASTADGLVSVGDLGWVDQDGYLYLADRRVDLIISGGANIYPAEVESALSEHAGIDDVAVVGLPHDDWGKQVHAIVQPREPASPPSVEDLDRHCRERLAAYKVPKSYAFMDKLPRDESGKIRRSALATAE